MTPPLVKGARSLLRSPAFTVLSVTTLALGIGAVTAMFTVLEQVVLRPLPVRDQDAVVVAWNVHTVRDVPHWPFFRETYEAVRDGVPSLEGVGATFSAGSSEVLARIGTGQEEVLRRSWIVGDVFGVLGVDPVLGRTLRAEDDVPGAARVAVISYDLWTRAWGRSPDAVGASLVLSDEPYTVVGVLPRDFDYPPDTDVWAAYRPAYVDRGLGEEFYLEGDLVARMRPGVTPERVAADIADLYRRWPEGPGAENDYEGLVPVVRPFEEVVVGDLRGTLFLLFGGALLVLVMACVNVAGLVGVRAAGREPWIAVKRALGASRGRLVRESASEAAWLGLLGGAGGALVAALTIRVLVPLAPPGLARVDVVTPPDALALSVTGGVTAAVVLLLAVLPVLAAGRVDPARSLRGGGRSVTGGRRRRQGGIVVVQAALAVWCAAAGVLLARSLANLQALDLGFRVDDLVLVDLQVPYGVGQLPEDFPDRLERVAGRLVDDPSVEAVTPMLGPPLIGDRGWLFVPRLEGQSEEEAVAENPMPNWEVVEPGYFETLALPVLRGRPLGPEDRAGTAQVVVVNRAAARALWPGEDALGKRLGAFERQTGEAWWTVVGVAADARYQDFMETRPVVYFPMRQINAFPSTHLLVRVSGATDGLLPRVQGAFAEEDPSIRVKGATSLRARLEAPLARPRFAVLILGTLAAATLLLAAVGVYGVMAAAVRARRGEVGVRMALGAAPGRVRALLLGDGMRLAAAGGLLGAAAFLVGGKLLESLVFQVAPADPWSLAAGAVVVLAVALSATWLPAARAARLDPARVLRAE